MKSRRPTLAMFFGKLFCTVGTIWAAVACWLSTAIDIALLSDIVFATFVVVAGIGLMVDAIHAEIRDK